MLRLVDIKKLFFVFIVVVSFALEMRLAFSQEIEPMQGDEARIATQVDLNSKFKNMALSLSFPQILTLERSFGINERSYFEAYVGGLPLSSLLFLDTKLSDANYSETHKIAYSLSAWTFTSGLRYGRYLSDSWSLIGDLGLLYVHGGAQLHLKNIDNGSKIPFMSVGATLVQPIFGLTIRKSWNRWALGLSVNVLMGSSISIKKSGWFPSFQEVAPDYKDSIDSGSEAAEDALKTSINKLKASFNLLPGLALSYRF
jgi:hypothetical protein